MKPVIIIVIAVVCSVVAVLTILFVFQQVENSQIQKQNEALQEYYDDLDLAESYRVEYDEIAWNSCLKNPLPSSYQEGVRQLAEAERNLEYVLRMQPRVFSLEQNMQFLQEKYPNSDYFEFEEVNCPYEEEWAIAIEALRDYQRELTGELTTEEIDKVEIFVSKQYEKCIEENTSKFICDAKLGEFTESAKLVYGIN